MSAARQRLSAAIRSNGRVMHFLAHRADQVSRSPSTLPSATTTTLPAPPHLPHPSHSSHACSSGGAAGKGAATPANAHAHARARARGKAAAAATTGDGSRMMREMRQRVCESEARQLRGASHSLDQLRCFTTAPVLASAWGSPSSTAAAAAEAPSAPAKDGKADEGEESITVTFIQRDGTEATVQVPVGTNMLQAAHDNDIDLEGACEGSLACSTCHVIVMDEDQYSKMPEPTDEENDMLDLAFGLTETSRLGCQVIATRDLDGVRLKLPSATRNFAVDGFVPKPH
ncbi:hypothetical protein CLOP_g24955 [Closterium sp. NIES-67]|nr:hypothetical protein CLOP_g24955 [Closterium sp. NIES-67]